jgi:biotin carboxyl carrier protein
MSNHNILSHISSLKINKKSDYCYDFHISTYEENWHSDLYIAASENDIYVNVAGNDFVFHSPRYTRYMGNTATVFENEVRSPMAGKVFDVFVQEGQTVRENDLLFIVESMKMQLEVKAQSTAIVSRICVEKNQIMNGPNVMCLLEKE